MHRITFGRHTASNNTHPTSTGPTRLTPLKRLAVVLALALAAVGVTMAVNPGAANASSTGCARWGSVYIPVVHMSIPTGQYCFGISGSGTHVNFTDGSINTPVIYNFSEDVRFYNARGENYFTAWEPTHWGAAYGYHYWRTNINGNAQRGRVCGELTSGGVVIVTVCEMIF